MDSILSRHSALIRNFSFMLLMGAHIWTQPALALSSGAIEKRIQSEEIDASSQKEIFEFMPAARLESFLKFHAARLIPSGNSQKAEEGQENQKEASVPLCLGVIELNDESSEDQTSSAVWLQSLKRRFQRRSFTVRELKDEFLMAPLKARLSFAKGTEPSLEQKFSSVFESFAGETKRLGCTHCALFFRSSQTLGLAIEVRDQYQQDHRALQTMAVAAASKPTGAKVGSKSSAIDNNSIDASSGANGVVASESKEAESIQRSITRLTLAPFETLGPQLMAGQTDANEADLAGPLTRSPASLSASLASSEHPSSAPRMTSSIGSAPTGGDNFLTLRIEGFRNYAEYEIVRQKITSQMEGVRSVQEKRFWYRGAELVVDTLHKPKEFGNLILARLGAQVTIEKVEAKDASRELRLLVKDTAPEATP